MPSVKSSVQFITSCLFCLNWWQSVKFHHQWMLLSSVGLLLHGSHSCHRWQSLQTAKLFQQGLNMGFRNASSVKNEMCISKQQEKGMSFEMLTTDLRWTSLMLTLSSSPSSSIQQHASSPFSSTSNPASG